MLRRDASVRHDRRHRFHALAFPRQQQPRAIFPQRFDPIRVTEHRRQNVDMATKRASLASLECAPISLSAAIRR